MASKHREWDPACKVYIGNLKSNASKYELEDLFTKYGPLKNIWIARNPPGFAFVEYEDPRDAEDAVRGLDGTKCGDSRIVVQMSTGKRRAKDKSPDYRRRSPPRRSYRMRSQSRSRSRSPYRHRRTRSRSYSNGRY
ncbi:serine/arginine-rich splicing factor 3-like isoform X2 [Daktulosphaira vitifoliae]|uniref:serine/arginine-rich splicing factor 3-like isoform X2 n=1 Tax=Daktulosphaira vitifoliae TaxID=58002 RepID=UPI0021AACD0F|nr:serine/arginine-rich splicing factor 3-like isoform X2 [Daktulosphaira vitifoliae]